jgi:hypothetical protein
MMLTREKSMARMAKAAVASVRVTRFRSSCPVGSNSLSRSGEEEAGGGGKDGEEEEGGGEGLSGEKTTPRHNKTPFSFKRFRADVERSN